MNDTTGRKDTQRLQRAIVDGLEDVKAQDIRVFDTEHLSPLFERVIVASGTSNRQTKALAASVRDAVREAGFPKPRVEGEENGEWIIVDCGAAVAHVMQPAIRTYYHLEEIWGEKPVRMRFGAPKPMTPEPEPEKVALRGPVGKAAKSGSRTGVKAAGKTSARSPASRKAPAAKKPAPSRSSSDRAPAAKSVKATAAKPSVKRQVAVTSAAAKKASRKATPKAPARKA